jgi:hypothetical protein
LHSSILTIYLIIILFFISFPFIPD